jgi:Domain of unknown function (DUF4386)
MKSNRKTAILVGMLFIIGTVSGVLSLVFVKPVLDAPDYLAKIGASQSQIVIGALLVLTMGLALALVPVLMFPILRKHNEVLALGYVVFRGALETVTYIASVISWLLLVPLSQAYVQDGILDPSYFQVLGVLARKAAEYSATLTSIIFPLGAIMFYSVLYQSKLVPRWLSVWGLIGVALHFVAAGLLGMFGFTGQMSMIQDLAALPIFIQEMVMAIWLIVKGFDPSAMTSGSSQTNMTKYELAHLG